MTASVNASAARSRATEERRLPPRGQRVDPLLGLADRPRVLGVHVDAVRAAVELRRADAQQLAQAGDRTSTRSSSFVAAWSRWLSAREKTAACLSKSSRARICVVSARRRHAVQPYPPSGPRVWSTSMAKSWANHPAARSASRPAPARACGPVVEHALRDAVAQRPAVVPARSCRRRAALAARPRDRPQHGRRRLRTARRRRVAGRAAWGRGRASPIAVAPLPSPASAPTPTGTTRLRSRPACRLAGSSPAFPRTGWLAASPPGVERRAAMRCWAIADPRGLPELRQASGRLSGTRTRRPRQLPDRLVDLLGLHPGLGGALSRALRTHEAAKKLADRGLQHSRLAPRRRCRPTGCSLSTAARRLPGSRRSTRCPPRRCRRCSRPRTSSRSVITLAPEAQRRAPVRVGTSTADALIIEDDYDGEFRYDRRPIGADAGHSTPDARHLRRHARARRSPPGCELGWLAVARRACG